MIACERLGPWSYRVDMGAPRLEWDAIPLAPRRRRHAAGETCGPKAKAPADLGPASVVNMGNPHAVFFVPDLERIDAAELGAEDRGSSDVPGKGQCHLRSGSRPRRVRARVWERGVGLTLACGSAACATLVAAARLGLMERKGTVRLPGGDLVIEWRASDDHVLMTGPVEYEGAFVLDDALFEAAAAVNRGRATAQPRGADGERRRPVSRSGPRRRGRLRAGPRAHRHGGLPPELGPRRLSARPADAAVHAADAAFGRTLWRARSSRWSACRWRSPIARG